MSVYVVHHIFKKLQLACMTRRIYLEQVKDEVRFLNCSSCSRNWSVKGRLSLQFKRLDALYFRRSVIGVLDMMFGLNKDENLSLSEQMCIAKVGLLTDLNTGQWFCCPCFDSFTSSASFRNMIDVNMYVHVNSCCSFKYKTKYNSVT